MAELNALYRFFILRAISEYRPVSNFLYLLTYFVASFVRNGDVETNNRMHNKSVHSRKNASKIVDRFRINSRVSSDR